MATPSAPAGSPATPPLGEVSVTLEGRRGQLTQLLADLERDAAQAAAERAAVLQALTQAEQARVQVLEHRRLARADQMAVAMRSSADLYVRLRRLDARLDGLEERRAGLGAERDQLNRLQELVAALAGDPALLSADRDDRRILCRRAERELIRLVTQDHDAVAERLFQGPLEDLADLALAVELIGRRAPGAADARLAGELSGCRQAAQSALERMQRLLFQVHPAGLAEEGLVSCVRRYAEQLAGEVAVRLDVIGEEPALRPAVARAAFRVVSEAVDNARRHAHAEEVEVVLSFSPGRLHVVVGDRGEGFDLAAAEARLGRSRGMGLIGMRERVENVGGSLDVRSTPGAGTEVRAVFDLAWR
jgi:signal transduction histidine kinase